jgi:hypothetical protein
MAADGASRPGGHPEGAAQTTRKDAWWFEPLWSGLGFLIFSLYATWESFQGTNYFVGEGGGFGGYLSPFYSPLLFTDVRVWPSAPVGHALFGEVPAWWPTFFPSVSAALILPFPLSFRLTCYYYRKFYYRAYMGTPPGCAVNPLPLGRLPTGRYEGERTLFLFQNLHRYALYASIVVIGFLFYDALLAFFRDGHLFIGLGSLILLVNPILLSTYTFGCHAWRHLVGGRKDCFSCDSHDHAKGMQGAYGRWKAVTWLNERHMLFAWISMIWVGWTAVYVRLVASETIPDIVFYAGN